MTIAQPPRRRADRRGYDDVEPNLLDWLRRISTVCGICYGHRLVWCPVCWGFGGCRTCYKQGQVPCPDCAGGHMLPRAW